MHGVIVMFPQAEKGDLWLSVSATPIRTYDGQTHGVVATYTDITAVHALQEQQKALLQTVSHDLRAPLAVIKGHEQVVASMLEEQGVNGTIQQSRGHRPGGGAYELDDSGSGGCHPVGKRST